jgi:hypothetical protein
VAYIFSIYKEGFKKDLNNYRRISALNTMSQLYGKILKGLIEDIVILKEKADSELVDPVQTTYSV